MTFSFPDCRSWYLLTLEKELVLILIEGHDWLTVGKRKSVSCSAPVMGQEMCWEPAYLEKRHQKQKVRIKGAGVSKPCDGPSKS